MTNMMQIDTAWKEDVTKIYKNIKASAIELLQMNWALFLFTLTGGSFYPWICATRFFRVSWMLKALSHDRNVVPNLSRKCDRRSQRGDFDTSASIVVPLFLRWKINRKNSTLIFPPFLREHPQILCNFSRKSSTPFEGKSFRWQIWQSCDAQCCESWRWRRHRQNSRSQSLRWWSWWLVSGTWSLWRYARYAGHSLAWFIY